MKFNSPLFDRIRVKPTRTAAASVDGPGCQWHACKEKATHRAPKGRGGDKDYWHFCLDHVRQYNQSYNFFAGMNDAAVMAYQKDALTGHRPTWKMGNRQALGAAGFARLRQQRRPVRPVRRRACAPSSRRAPRRDPVRNAERKALEVARPGGRRHAGAGAHRFKELVKRHHPDANGGDRSTEERLIEVIQAYNYLKSVGFA